jgi:hypothetical protein
MLRRTFCLAVAAALIVTAGCAGRGEDVTKEQIQAMNDLADAMEKGDMAKAKEITERMQAIQKKYDDLKLSDDEKKKLQEKYKDEMEKAGLRMGKAMGLPGLTPPGLGGGLPGLTPPGGATNPAPGK